MGVTYEIPEDIIDEVIAALNRAIGLATAKEPALAQGFMDIAARLDDAINDFLAVEP